MIEKSLFLVIAITVLLKNSCIAAPLLVMDARGTIFKQGATIDSEKTITLKEGERLTLIGANGSTVTIRGPFSDVPMRQSAPQLDDRQNLTALIASREARTSAVGVVRAGADEAKLPDPWVLDVARSGKRCIKANSTPVLWREDTSEHEIIAVSPSDRSWRLELAWNKGQDQLPLPAITNFDSNSSLIIDRKSTEINLTIVIVPLDLPSPLFTASWLVNRGCVQQSNAMIQQLSMTLK